MDYENGLLFFESQCSMVDNSGLEMAECVPTSDWVYQLARYGVRLNVARLGRGGTVTHNCEEIPARVFDPDSRTISYAVVVSVSLSVDAETHVAKIFCFFERVDIQEEKWKRGY